MSVTSREDPEGIVEAAAAAAMTAAWEKLEGHLAPDTLVYVVIDRAKVPKGEQDSTAAAQKGDEQPTAVDVLTMLLLQAHVVAEAAGKTLRLVPIEQDPRGN